MKNVDSKTNINIILELSFLKWTILFVNRHLTSRKFPQWTSINKFPQWSKFDLRGKSFYMITPRGKAPKNSVEKKGKSLQDLVNLGQSHRDSTNLSKNRLTKGIAPRFEVLGQTISSHYGTDVPDFLLRQIPSKTLQTGARLAIEGSSSPYFRSCSSKFYRV